MGLSSAGIGSNLDVEGIVAKLMSVEQQPLTKLATTEASYQAKLSGFATLKGAISQFQTAVSGLSDITKFQSARASAADATIATASATVAASSGSYALKVTQLAQAQKLVAAGTASQSAPIGSGVLTFDFGSITGTADASGKFPAGTTFTSNGNGVKSINIDSSNNSLAGIRDAINKAAIGVTATIVNDGGASPYRLALSSTVTGANCSIKISVADTDPDTGLGNLLRNDPAGGQGLSQTVAAQNALFTLDGIAVSKSSNTVSDAINGVTLNLLKVNPDTATAVTVARDTASVITSVNAFVKAYNDISQTLRDASAYNATTKQAAILNGEASVRGIQTQVRNVLSTPIAGGASAFTRISEVGVTLQKDGLLAVDSTKLAAAVNTNFDDLAGLFAAAGKSTNSLASYSTASDETRPGSYPINVTSVATNGTAQGASAVTDTVIGSTNNTVDVQLNGVSATITLAQKNYGSAAALALEIQSKINGLPAFAAAGAAVTVSETGGVLKVSSNRFGSGSSVSITQAGTSTLMFDANPTNVIQGKDVAGTINGVAAIGNGQTLTGAKGDASAGLAVTINGATAGLLGSINYSQGYAYQFQKLTTDLLGTAGPLSSRTSGINASIKSLTATKEALGLRLGVIEKRYRAQFTALDLTISKMNTTSTFLTQQLAQISSMTSR